MPRFVIVHMEPRLWKWCRFEYNNIRKIVGNSQIQIINFSKFNPLKYIKPCILDSSAKKILTVSEAKKFQTFIFGGILGDFPAKKRTQTLVKKMCFAARRNLGRKQMPTDNAVYAVKKILGGVPLQKMKFVDGIEIKVDEYSSVELPFTYAVVRGKPLVSREILEMVKKQKNF